MRELGRILALFPRPTQIFRILEKKSSGGVGAVPMPIEARGRFGGQNTRIGAGRGLNPRPERSTPAECPPATPNLESPPPRESSCFLSSIQCPCVGGSFRSGVQPPTGTRLERSTPAECPPATPNLESPPPRESSCFLSSIQCPRVGGSFRSGVQPPTGTSSTPDRHREVVWRSFRGFRFYPPDWRAWKMKPRRFKRSWAARIWVEPEGS